MNSISLPMLTFSLIWGSFCFSMASIDDPALYIENTTYRQILVKAAAENPRFAHVLEGHFVDYIDRNLGREPMRDTWFSHTMTTAFQVLYDDLLNFIIDADTVYVRKRKHGPKTFDGCIKKDIATARELLKHYIDASDANWSLYRECGL